MSHDSIARQPRPGRAGKDVGNPGGGWQSVCGRLSRLLGLCSPVLVVAIVAGCDGANTARGPRVAVQGAVTLDGKPLQAAVIAFHCGQGEQEAAVTGIVQNGRYAIDADTGPWAGQVRVAFHPMSISEEQFDAAMEEAARQRRPPQLTVIEIPPHYGSQPAWTVQLTADGDNRFDFDLTSRRSGLGSGTSQKQR
jgi:hypothetical protein